MSWTWRIVNPSGESGAFALHFRYQDGTEYGDKYPLVTYEKATDAEKRELRKHGLDAHEGFILRPGTELWKAFLKIIKTNLEDIDIHDWDFDFAYCIFVSGEYKCCFSSSMFHIEEYAEENETLTLDELGRFAKKYPDAVITGICFLSAWGGKGDEEPPLEIIELTLDRKEKER